MKKITLFFTMLFVLFAFTACPNQTGTNDAEIEKELLQKEKKTVAENKEYKADDWTITVSGKEEDQRTIQEKFDNIPPKYDIVNILLYKHIKALTIQNSSKVFHPSIEIVKRIKYDTGDILFLLKLKLWALKTTQLSADTQLLKIDSTDTIVKKNIASIKYVPDPKMPSILHFIELESPITIKEITKLRTLSEKAEVILEGTGISFSIPKEFFTYLKDI